MSQCHDDTMLKETYTYRKEAKKSHVWPRNQVSPASCETTKRSEASTMLQCHDDTLMKETYTYGKEA